MKTIGYKIINDESVDGLVGQVREEIDEGWGPVGGVSVATVTTNSVQTNGQVTRIFFYQAMVKYETVSLVSDFRTMQMWVGG